MGTPSTMRSARWKRPANSWILSETAASAVSIGSLFMPLYFDPMASWSKSGSFSFQILDKTFTEDVENRGWAPTTL
jgi:hypothetical protein